MSSNLLPVLGALILSGVFLRLNGWRALLFLKPSRVLVDEDAPGDQVALPEPLLPEAKVLASLGFTLLGSHVERAAFAPTFISYDFASEKERAFATLYASRFGGARLYLFTPTEGGGFVITANYRRPSRNVPGRYVAGGMPGLPADRLLKAHLKRLEGLQPVGPFTLKARLEAAQAWFQGPARAEIRSQNLNGLVSSALSAMLFVLAALASIAILARR